MQHVEVVVDTVDKEPDDNMDVVYTEDMVVGDNCKVVWVALPVMSKVAVVDMEETQLMGLMMELLEKGEFVEAASHPNEVVVEEQHLRELDLMDTHPEH